MKKRNKSVGKLGERNKDFLTRANEFGEKASDHFSTMFIQRLKNVREVRLWVVEWVLLVTVVFLLAIVQIIWYSSSYETTAFTEGGEYTEASLGEIKSMNPLYATTSSEKTLAKLLFANLTSPDVSGHIGMDLAKSVTMDETGKVWTVTLRDNLRWSDGEEITADDIIYTIGLINDNSAKTTISADFSNIQLEKTDEKTVVFTLPSVYLDFADTLEFPLLPSHILKDVSPALVYEDSFSSNPVGSGPFMFKALQSGGGTNRYLQVVYLQRNDNYYGNKAKLASFNLRTYDNVGKIVDALRDSTALATAENINADGLKINHRTKLTNGGVYAFINTQSAVLKSLALRQAIQRGVDMTKVREGIDEVRNLDYPFLKTQEEALTYPALAEYNVESAKKLIGNAKLIYDENGKLTDETGMPVTLNLAVRKREPIQGVAQRFAEQLEELGFTVTVNVFDDSQPNMDFFAQVLRPRDYDILFYEVDLGVSADPFVYYSSSQANSNGWNFSNYGNALADDALLTSRITLDENLRTVKLNAFLQRWVNEVPAIGIYQSAMDYYYQDDIRIFSDDAEFTDALDRFSDVEYWATSHANVMQTP
jgi:peptide/nickel transport system substrate-binding protein